MGAVKLGPVRVHLQCTVEGCPEQGVIKSVPLTHLGGNVYQGPDLVCGGCGMVPVLVDVDDPAPR